MNAQRNGARFDLAEFHLAISHIFLSRSHASLQESHSAEARNVGRQLIRTNNVSHCSSAPICHLSGVFEGFDSAYQMIEIICIICVIVSGRHG